MKIIAIAAADQRNNSKGLKFFNMMTHGRALLMGRITAESLGKPLDSRLNIVLSRSERPELTAAGFTIVGGITEGITLAREAGHRCLYIIGGEQVYDETKPLWDRIIGCQLFRFRPGDNWSLLFHETEPHLRFYVGIWDREQPTLAMEEQGAAYEA